jgi:hypothetical protein
MPAGGDDVKRPCAAIVCITLLFVVLGSGCPSLSRFLSGGQTQTSDEQEMREWRQKEKESLLMNRSSDPGLSDPERQDRLEREHLADVQDKVVPH